MKRVALLSIAVSLTPGLGLAQSAMPASADAALDPAPPGVHMVDDGEPVLPLVPRANDLLGRHVLLGAAVGPTWSLGKLSSDVAAVRGLGTGLGFHADLGLGLSRSVALGAWGTFATYGDGDRCLDDCAGKAFAVGPFVRYHLSQGLRFDPWLSAGAGYRHVAFESDGVSNTFSGIEWLRLELGADYYLFSGLGFGPYGGISLSSYTDRPSGNASVNTELGAGIRFLLDVPGR